MKKYVRRNKYLLTFLVLFISIGFAYLSANFNILGSLSFGTASFDVHFENIVLGSDSYEGSILPTLNQDRDTISMNFSLDKPGDKLVFYADIVNSGTIDSQLGDLNISNTLSSTDIDLLDLSIKYLDGIDVSSGDVVLNGTRKVIKVVVGYNTDIDISDLPTEIVPFTIDIGPTFNKCDLSNLKTATFRPGEDVMYRMLYLSNSSISYATFSGVDYEITDTKFTAFLHSPFFKRRYIF